ncbi:hypothetical protein [Dyella mobilis]|uniref:GAPS4 PD-(D/E)XK nuclease domain-containing protein n=1 Tax=Dyella mobilis TaxID=1849582 RepID=A0ABS2KL27_9GAMM|nr:hypothetical protein [Dyella mobilis]MBM7131872.1 hypothetical protein [Dyella mobilis]GLQ96146.1 hypothetical protein GCM10007863_05640 [Dyella mobilis]
MGGETINISTLASKVSSDIFKTFKWNIHPHKDENFACLKKSNHYPKDDSESGRTHPTDAVFHYHDPYLGKNIYLLSDLKSYSESSLRSNVPIRKAITSLANAVDCAKVSGEWKGRYVIEDIPHEIRGMLFIYNHDNQYDENFKRHLASTNLDNLNLRQGQIIHLFDPEKIVNSYTIAQDMAHLSFIGEMSNDYTFVYPDLVRWKRQGDIWDQSATIETLTSPYLIIKYRNNGDKKTSGYVIYYNRGGEYTEEFMYLIDTLSRFQILSERLPIKIRMTSPNEKKPYLNNFEKAKSRYLREWNLDEIRKNELDQISVESIQKVVPNYSAMKAGWRNEP